MFDDYIKNNIKWLKNEIKHHPQWSQYPNGDNLSSETYEILDYLIELNDLGFYTVCSQPITENPHAFVNGYITLKMCEKLFEVTHLYPDINFDIQKQMAFYDSNIKNVVFVWIKSETPTFWNDLVDIFKDNVNV